MNVSTFAVARLSTELFELRHVAAITDVPTATVDSLVERIHVILSAVGSTCRAGAEEMP